MSKRGYRQALFGVVAISALTVPLHAAPDRKPHGPSSAAQELMPVPLDQLPKEGGVLYGNWLVCKNVDEQGVIIIHRQSKLAIYLPWASNGWINYRSPDGTSYVHWSRGGADPQARNYYLDKLMAQPPTTRLGDGKHTFVNWTVTAGPESIEFHCTSMGCRLTVPRYADSFTHNGRTVAGR